ncbi:MAG: fimbrial biosis outer rane usher protein [Sphingomonadales bacterium]|nr:fimbrial biosis outer rane usher protein [Sphingomonadales bacterium]
MVINGIAQRGDFLIARQGSEFFARPEDLITWGIRKVPQTLVMIEKEQFVSLASVSTSLQFDPTVQSLALTIPPDRFSAQDLSAVTARMQPTESALAVFLNYDLSVQYKIRAHAGLFLEAGVSDDWGLIASTMTVDQRSGPNSVTRLDSYYLRDNPTGLTRLVVGDAVTDAQDWSRQIRFGGVRFGTDFNLQPNVLTFPTPAFTGRAAIPSNVELLVNNVRAFQTDVSQGPFSINRVPFVNGAGDVTLVVRDALGVERRVTSSYYVSSSLLSRGLSSWSMEAGAERDDYGIRSFSYNNAFVAGSYRRGVTDWLTVETRTEISKQVQMTGGGIDVVWAPFGEFGFTGAASRGSNGNGALFRLFFRRIAPRWNVAVNYQRALHNFSQLGIYRDADRITRQLQASAGVSLGRRGNLGVVYTDLAYADRNRTRITTSNYSVSVADRAYLSVFAVRSGVTGARTETTFGVGLTMPFGPRVSGSVQTDSHNILAEIHKTPPTDGGWGYRITANKGDSDRQQAEILWRGNLGEAAVEAEHTSDGVGLRGLASGGLVFTGGRAYATRRVEDALGVINVPDLPNVRIYQENRLVTRTDSAGRAIIPDLRAYEPNRITIAPSDVPIGDRMSSDSVLVVPRHRGAVSANFAIVKDHSATILLQTPDGQAVDAGTTVKFGNGDAAFVGYGGEMFARNVMTGLTLDFLTERGSCRVVIGKVPDTEVLPRIGPIRCTLQDNEP